MWHMKTQEFMKMYKKFKEVVVQLIYRNSCYSLPKEQKIIAFFPFSFSFSFSFIKIQTHGA